MGVYNPWAEMPRSCVACDFEMSCPLASQYEHAMGNFVHPDCLLVEVKTPHGRLIDADYIYNAVERRYRVSSGAEHRAERDFLDLICDAPTVLEAEGKDDV